MFDRYVRPIVTLALVFVAGCASCTDDPKKGGSDPECADGESLNPITGNCEPSSTNVTPGPDMGEGDDMGEPDPDMEGGPDLGPSDAGTDMLVNTCTGTERRCNQGNVETCVNGMFTVTQTCGDGFVCERGNCVPENAGDCTPGETRCAGAASFETCEADGMSWSPAEACDDGDTCAMGECTGGCAGLLDPKKSNEGCDYVTMRHDQATGLQVLPHTVVVSNPGDQPVDVQVTSPGGINPGINPQTIQPLDSAVLNFPKNPMIQQAGLSSNIYRIAASRPVIATQFSPLNNPGLGSETSDASLLLPTNAVGKEYVVVGWRSLQPGGTYVDIVAIEDDTMVSVESPVPLSGGGAGSVAENGSAMFSIPKDQVLHLKENRSFFDTGDRDVSGVRITSNKPVAVYTGATIINIPDEPVLSSPPMGCTMTDMSCTQNEDCCSGICGYDPQMSTYHCMDSLEAGDHVEQQLFPVESWGNSYVAVPFPSRGDNDFTMYRVVAGTDGTTITLDPPVNGVSNLTLNAGEMRQIYGPAPFELTATAPVMVGQFMIGGSTSDGGNGDPAFLLPPAIQQYRDSYVFLVPGNYVLNYVTLVKQAAAQITLDGSVVPQADFQPVGGAAGWEYTVVESLAAGVHTATASAEFGVVVHGMDEYISYAFPGGVTLPEP